MKSDQYRESTGRRLRDAYMSEPVQRSASAEDFDKWKKAELAALVVYIIFAIPASLFGGIMHFFVVNDKKAISFP